LPVEVATKDIQLPLGMADDRVTHYGFLPLLFIVPSLIIIVPQSSKTHECARGRRARIRASDDANTYTNGYGRCGQQRHAQKRPTAASSLHVIRIEQQPATENKLIAIAKKMASAFFKAACGGGQPGRSGPL
jgi:hypothetical protein